MNYNVFMNPIFPDLPKNNRAKLDTGTECNYNCYFCYYKDKLDIRDSYNTIINRAKKLKELGIIEVDLSGGESSIHPNWFEILDYCNKNFENVSCLSNGSKFKDYDFLEKSKKYGLTEILFSLHGYDEKSHDKIVNHKDAWKDILQSIENAKKLQIQVRINCTVTKHNYQHLNSFAKIINSIKPHQINFLPLNYWENADKLKTENYKELSNSIKSAIDIIQDIEINVRYIPFCFMKGYEKYVVNTLQHIYDLKDWNICAYHYQDLSKYKEIAKRNILNTYFKPKKCYSCDYFHICDGIEYKYKDKDIINPIKEEKNNGKDIRNPMYFRTDRH